MEQPRSGEHLSAEVLNAYAERALPATEEREALEHLSACAECREILYLANAAMEEQLAEQFATEAATGAPKRHTPSRFRGWAWALPVAAVLLVASAALLQPKLMRMKQAEPTQQIAQAKRDEPQFPKEATSPAASSATAAPANAAKSAPEKPSRLAAPRVVSPPAASPSRDFAFNLSKDKAADAPAEPVLSARNSLSLDSGTVRNEAKTAPAMDAVSPQTGAAGYGAGATAGAGPKPASAIPQSHATVEVSSEATVNTRQAEGAENQKTAQFGLANGGAVKLQSTVATDSRAKKTEAARPRWRVTANGTLEHFINGAWQTTLEDSKVEFLTVENFKKDVWAAGKNLALYHSSDNGKHWERQTVPAAAPADIVHIEFNSALNGTLKTSTGGGFSTVDGGKTWAGI